MSDEIFRKLSEHPLNKQREKDGLPQANVVLLRGCGIKMEAEPFNNLFGTKAVSICPTAILAGLTMSIGIDREVVPGATGDYHTDLNKKADAAYDLLYKRGYEFCFLHVKGYDEAGHDQLVNMREEFVKKIDEMVVRFIDQARGESVDCVISLTGDHSTPMYYGDHSFEPVPFTVSTKQSIIDDKPFFLADSVEHFDEVSAAQGVLGRFPGREVMKLMFKIRDRVNKSGYY